MKTLQQVLSKFTPRNVKDLIMRATANSVAYKIACCSGTLNEKDFKSIEKIPENIPCSDSCRGLVINPRPTGKTNRFVCNECIIHIHVNGYSELPKVISATTKERPISKKKSIK